MNWTAISQEVANGVNLIAPFASALAPEAAPAILIINRIIQGAVAAEPAAVALVQQIQSGTIPTQTQLAQYYAQYQADDDALKADIDAHLTALRVAQDGDAMALDAASQR